MQTPDQLEKRTEHGFIYGFIGRVSIWSVVIHGGS